MEAVDREGTGEKGGDCRREEGKKYTVTSRSSYGLEE